MAVVMRMEWPGVSHGAVRPAARDRQLGERPGARRDVPRRVLRRGRLQGHRRLGEPGGFPEFRRQPAHAGRRAGGGVEGEPNVTITPAHAVLNLASQGLATGVPERGEVTLPRSSARLGAWTSSARGRALRRVAGLSVRAELARPRRPADALRRRGRGQAGAVAPRRADVVVPLAARHPAGRRRAGGGRSRRI